MKRFNIVGAGFVLVPSQTGKYVSHRAVVSLVKKLLVPKVRGSNRSYTQYGLGRVQAGADLLKAMDYIGKQGGRNGR